MSGEGGYFTTPGLPNKLRSMIFRFCASSDAAVVSTRAAVVSDDGWAEAKGEEKVVVASGKAIGTFQNG
jgi:hypothetical protein